MIPQPANPGSVAGTGGRLLWVELLSYMPRAVRMVITVVVVVEEEGVSGGG